MRSVKTSRLGGIVLRVAIMALLLGPTLAACGSSFGNLGATVKRGAFTSSEYGVAVSPRVTRDPNPPRGGGRYMIGRPYTVRGQVYTPREQPDYQASGTASWYGSDFHGRRTANGEIFSANAISGAHPTLPLPSYVRVTNTDNGRSVVVRVNDRGPYVHGRVIDLSHRAADMLGYVNKGMTGVQVQYVGPAPLNGDDTRYLLASLRGGDGRGDARIASTSGGARDPHSLADFAGDFINLFSYTETGEVVAGQDGVILDAGDAANALATRSPALLGPESKGEAIAVALGTFTDLDEAERVASAFAMLGAVDEKSVSVGDRAAKHLELIRLRPGVVREDVAALIHQLGLSDAVLY